MMQRQFIFSPKHSNLLDKDLYVDVEFNSNQAILTLKENVKIGYANSFEHAMDYIHTMSRYFVPDTISEISLFNGITLLQGKGLTSNETVMDLTVDYFNYPLPDINKVTIEMKGVFNPSIKLEGYFIGEFSNSLQVTEDKSVMEFFSSVKGDVLSNKEIMRENIATSLLITDSPNGLMYELRYLGVKQNDGELFCQTILVTNSVKELLCGDSRYEDLIKSSINHINTKKELSL